jgi:hypothetical protein
MPILIPVQLQKAMRELPPIPQFAESLPKPPPPSPEPVNLIQGAIAIIGLMFILGVLGNFIPPIWIILLLIVGLGVILWQMQVQYITFKSRLRDHAGLTENYFLLLTTYSRKESEHEQKIALTLTDQSLKAYRQPKILKILSKTNGEIGQKALTGDSLKISDQLTTFGKDLKKSLGDRLHQSITIQIPAFNFRFSPDFTYINPATNLHLAIAISEVSDQTSKEQQNICNSFLLKSGWIVAHFTPQEVLENPDRYVKSIVKLVDELD